MGPEAQGGEVGVEADAGSDDDAPESARRRLAARLALLALALLALGGPAAAYLATTRPCWSHAAGTIGRDYWALFWPYYVLHAPASLALAAWCVAVRRRARPGEPLHAWARRFAACAAASGAAQLARPALDPGCHGAVGAAWYSACEALHSGAYLATLLVPFHLLVLKLRALGLRRRARLAHAALRVTAAGGAALAVAYVALVALGRPGPGDGPVAAALWGAAGVGALVALLAGAALTACGAWGLLTAAARAARSGRAGVARAVRWVRGTAALVVLSYLLTLAEGLLLIFAGGGTGDGDLVHAWAWGKAVNNGFNCLQVALLSGLAGPRSLRRLAVQAFEHINCYTAEELQMCYEEFLAYLDDAQVKWVRFGYLRHLADSGSIMVRCQDVPAAEAVIGRSGFPDDRGDPKHRFVLSHPWLSKQHPDPSGAKLRMLVRQLDLLNALEDDSVFIDYMGLPQHNAQDPEYGRLEQGRHWPKPGEHPAVRTEAEEALFRKALGSMELMYSMSSTPVIVLPMDDEVAAGTEYLSRGWCFFEFCLAFSFGNTANAAIHPPVEQMCRTVAEMRADTVEGFRKGFRATHFTSKGDKAVVIELFEKTLKKRKPLLRRVSAIVRRRLSQ